MTRFNRTPLHALGVALVSLGMSSAAFAQGTTPATPSAPPSTAPATPPAARPADTPRATTAASKLDRADRKFIEEAAMGGMLEVALGNVAKSKAASDQVKQFGARMVEDHTKANDELQKLAAAKGVTLPASLDRKHQGMVDRMQKMTGADFDRAYVKEMVSDHKKDVSDFEKVSRSGKDADVKAFASKTLPTLQAHRKMADELNTSVAKVERETTTRRPATQPKPGG